MPLSDRILTPAESLAVRILMERLGLDVPALAGSTDVHEAILQVADVSFQAGFASREHDATCICENCMGPNPFSQETK